MASKGSIAPTLYRSVRRAARFCDYNHGLRRHLLSRLVREAIFIDGIATPDAVRRLADDRTFSLVRSVSDHFRRAAAATGGGGSGVAGKEDEDEAAHGISQAFKALKMYRVAVDRVATKQTLVKPFAGGGVGGPSANVPLGVDAAQHQAEQEVLEANAEFYAALREASMERLERICHHQRAEWGQPGCIHPARGLIEGWGRIAESWLEIFSVSEAEDGSLSSAAAAARLSIGLRPETVRVNLPPGSGVAWVTGVEVFGGDEDGNDPYESALALAMADAADDDDDDDDDDGGRGRGRGSRQGSGGGSGGGGVDSVQIVRVENEDGDVIEEWAGSMEMEIASMEELVAGPAAGMGMGMGMGMGLGGLPQMAVTNVFVRHENGARSRHTQAHTCASRHCRSGIAGQADRQAVRLASLWSYDIVPVYRN